MTAGKGVAVPLRYLQPVFAPNMDAEVSTRLFKQRLKSDLKVLAKVYSRFNVSVQGDVLWLNRSEAPISPKITYLV